MVVGVSFVLRLMLYNGVLVYNASTPLRHYHE